MVRGNEFDYDSNLSVTINGRGTFSGSEISKAEKAIIG